MNKIIIKRIILGSFGIIAILLITLMILNQRPIFDDGFKPDTQATSFTNQFNWDKELINQNTNPTYDSISYNTIHEIIEPILNGHYTLARDLNLSNTIINLTNGKYVSIENANDLYNLSIAASYNWLYGGTATRNRQPFIETIKTILGLDYILHNDIDYSLMRSKQFIPLGINVRIPSIDGDIYYDLPFTGTFNGNGFTIANLYLADYSYITTVYSLTGDEDGDLDFPLAPYYAMFAYTSLESVIANFSLVDPVLEVLDTHEDLSKAANLVGLNYGTIYNISVLDTKKRMDGSDNSGIRLVVQSGFQMSGEVTASGFVHTNYGTITNSFFVGQYIVSPNYRERFMMQPFVYHNYGTIKNTAYDYSVYDLINNGQPTPIEGVSEYNTTQFRNGLINDQIINISDYQQINYSPKDRLQLAWRYYPQDGYPSLRGLEYDPNGYFKITNEFDFLNMYYLIDLSTSYQGTFYNYHTYVVLNNINLINIKEFITPTNPFHGELHGKKGSNDLLDNSYLLNLNLKNPYISNDSLYLGMFSTLTGYIHDLNIYQSSLTLVETGVHYNKNFYLGMLAGVSDNASVTRILTDLTIDLGTEAITNCYVGGLIGSASGEVSYVATSGAINGNIHNFSSAISNTNYYIGGIIGSTGDNALRISHSINKSTVYGIGNNQVVTTTTNNNLLAVGGIIGLVNNKTADFGNSLYYLTNYGSVGSYRFRASQTTHQYLGGIFGISIGYSLATSEIIDGEEVLKNGSWESIGDLIITNTNYSSNERFYAAGIGVAQNSVLSDYYYMVNKSSYQFTTFNGGIHNTNVFYAATIIDNGAGVRLIRAYNQTNYTYDNSYLTTSNSEILIAPFFTSVTDQGSELIYCVNNGTIRVGTTSTANITNQVKIAGITLANRVHYNYVFRTGDIIVTNISSNSQSGSNLYVAGIAWVLPYINGIIYTASNCLTEGDIYTAGIGLNTTIALATTGQTNFRRTVNANNLYVAGMFNINNGDISNSLNYGNISSTFGNISNITGKCNTFVGGLVTFNYNLIKDCANFGNIIYTNTSTNSGSNFDNGPIVADSTSASSTCAGIVFAYYGGLSLGGIAAAFGDINATILNGYKTNGVGVYYAQIIDTSNNGDIYGKAVNYVRSGGILAIALGVELCAGTSSASASNTTSTATTTGIFASNNAGNTDPIGNCILSNGLNFGNIYAITRLIAGYNSTSSNATGQRPAIYSAAGGVIGYGLCVMTKMLNHGTVAATDVAGGIVGATYVLGNIVTPVNIDTAVHYGAILAIAVDASGTGSSSPSTSSQTSVYNAITYERGVNNTLRNANWITPSSATQTAPTQKRGFGGIFGRLQRGFGGEMTSIGSGSSTFTNIMNCDPNIDFIGRLDQHTTFTGSMPYFLFTNSAFTTDDSFYTAKPNDFTQAVFSGFYARTFTRATFSGAVLTVRCRRSGSGNSSTYNIQQITYTGSSSQGTATIDVLAPRSIGSISANDNRLSLLSRTINNLTTSSNFSLTLNGITGSSYSRNNLASLFGIQSSSIPTTGTTINLTVTVNTSSTLTLTSTSSSVSNTAFPLNKITEDPLNNQPLVDYIYDPSFPLSSQSEFIYYSAFETLADRFRNTGSSSYRPNGMYVLASSEGRVAGSVLPANLQIDHLYKIKEPAISSGKYLDLTNLEVTGLDPSYLDIPDHNSTLLTNYRQMFQVRYNDQSAVLNSNTGSNLADLVLYDPTGNSPTLTGGVIDDVNKTITFTVATNAFSTSNYNVNYQVLSASLSPNAAIARVGITTGQFNSYNQAYLNRSSNVILGTFMATMSATLSVNNTRVLTNGSSNFSFTVYSELASQVQGLITNGAYKTDYQVIVSLRSSFNVSMSNVIANNSSLGSQSISNNTFNLNLSLNFDSSIFCQFTNTSTLLPLGHNLTIHQILIDGQVIDPSFYSIEYLSAYASGNSRILGFTVNFDQRLRNGNYQIIYTYYDTGIQYTINFSRSISTDQRVFNVKYDTYSQDIGGNSQIFTPTSSNFTTYIQFGKSFGDIVTTTSNQSLQIVTMTYPSAESYLADQVKYRLYLNGQLIIEVEFASFATLTNALISCRYDSNNYRYYDIRYTVRSGSGSSRNITHTLAERDLDPLVVYRGNVKEFSNLGIKIAREALSTQFYLDFGFITSMANQAVEMNIFGVTLLPGHIDQNYQLSTDRYFEFLITNQLSPGIYTYNFNYRRENGQTFVLQSLEIEKLQGTSAYLQDINFQTDGGTTTYPIINATNANGDINNQIGDRIYDPRVYFAGIDYDNLDDLVGHQYFRIDGRVSNIDLELYVPFFNLPVGATIERFNGTTWVSDLQTSFISMVDDDDAVVLYRITSEDRSSQVFYYLTATDIIYNLTIRFEIYLRDSNGRIRLASNSEIASSTVLITTKNYQLSGIPTEIDQSQIGLAYPGAGIMDQYITGIRTQSTQFYYPVPQGINYAYTFGRGLSGYYGFSVIAPIYRGNTNEYMINGQRYQYSIYLLTGTNYAQSGLNNLDTSNPSINNYLNNFLLPDLDNQGIYDGKYFFIEDSTKNRIRVFAIVIESLTSGSKWGLHDYITSWDQ